MKQDLTGGYCPRCDTVWASPGVCRCKIDKSKMSEEDKLYWKDQVDYLNEKADDRRKIWSDHAASVFETEIWNKAIEAAALKVEGEAVGQLDGFYVHDCNEHAANIRKLKR